MMRNNKKNGVRKHLCIRSNRGPPAGSQPA